MSYTFKNYLTYINVTFVYNIMSKKIINSIYRYETRKYRPLKIY